MENKTSSRIDPELFKQSKEILDLRDDIKKYGRKGKIDFEKEWFRNILFFVGRQWISWGNVQKKWIDTPELGKWYPKPVTNKFASSCNALKSLITEKKIRPIVTPATDSEEDIATSQRADTWVDVLSEESGKDQVNSIAASWNIVTGNCFWHNFYEVNDKYGTVVFNVYKCPSCGEHKMATDFVDGQCQDCGFQGSPQDFPKGVDEGGNPMTGEMPRGKLRIEAVSPFEMFFNTNVENFEQVRELIRCKTVTVKDAEEMYPDLKDKITGDVSTESNQIYKKALRTVSQSSSGYGVAVEGNNAPEADMDYMYVMPCDKYPEGIYAVITGQNFGELMTMEDSTDKDGNAYLPFVHAGGNHVPGRFWKKTRADDIAQKQIDRNLFESLLQLQMLTMGSGKWLDPKTNMGTPTGEPGEVIEFDYTVQGRKPEMIPGVPPPSILVEILKLIDKDIEEATATYDVIKGQLPPGLDTFSGLRLLTERAFSVHGETLEQWELAQAKIVRQQLEIARKQFIEPRSKTVEGETGGFETQSFSRADLQGGVDIKVEPGSSIPMSKAVENAAVADSIKLGLIDIQDPKVKYKILEKLGQQDLATTDQEDIKDAMREWKDFLESVNDNPNKPDAWVLRPRYGIDNEMIHYRDAIARAKTDTFFKLPPEAQKMWVEHAQIHQTNMQKDAMQQQAMSAPPIKAPGKSRELGAPTSPGAGLPPPNVPGVPATVEMAGR